MPTVSHAIIACFFFFSFSRRCTHPTKSQVPCGAGGNTDQRSCHLQRTEGIEGGRYDTHTHTCVHKKKSLKSVIHSGGGRGCLQYVTSLCCRSPSYFFPSEFRLLPSNRSVLLGSLVYVYIFSSFLYVAFCFYCMYVYIVEKSEKNGKIHYKFNVVSLDKRTRAWKPD